MHPNKEEMVSKNMEICATVKDENDSGSSKKIMLQKPNKSCNSFKCRLCESVYNCKPSLGRHMRIKHTVRKRKNVMPKVATNTDTSENNFNFDKVDEENTSKINLATYNEQLNEMKTLRDQICEITYRFHIDVDYAVLNILGGLTSHIPNTASNVSQT